MSRFKGPQLITVKPNSEEYWGFYIENLSGKGGYSGDAQDLEGDRYFESVVAGYDEDGCPVCYEYSHLDYLVEFQGDKLVAHLPQENLDEFLEDLRLLKLPYVVEYNLKAAQ